MDEAFNDDLLAVVAQVKDNWTLCNFLGKSEKEYLVAETIHAARINLRERGEPFSFKGDIQDSPDGITFQNRASYAALVTDGLFREERRTFEDAGEVTVIFPTRKLIDKLKVFLEQQQAT